MKATLNEDGDSIDRAFDEYRDRINARKMALEKNNYRYSAAKCCQTCAKVIWWPDFPLGCEEVEVTVRPEWVCDKWEAKRRCRVCGCTDDDSSGCVEKTGESCYWVGADLCSACAGEGGN